MSEKDNVARITKIYEAFGRGDIGYILDQLTEDVRWVSRLDPVVPWHGDFSSKARVPKFFEGIHANVDMTAFEPQEFVAQGDTVVSIGDCAYQVRATGKVGRSRWVFIWKFREGRVASYEQFHDEAASAAFRA